MGKICSNENIREVHAMLTIRTSIKLRAKEDIINGQDSWISHGRGE